MIQATTPYQDADPGQVYKADLVRHLQDGLSLARLRFQVRLQGVLLSLQGLVVPLLFGKLFQPLANVLQVAESRTQAFCLVLTQVLRIIGEEGTCKRKVTSACVSSSTCCCSPLLRLVTFTYFLGEMCCLGFHFSHFILCLKCRLLCACIPIFKM